MTGKAAIQRGMYRKEKAIVLITVAAMALSVTVLSVMFLIRENSQAFFEHKARELAGCDVRVNIAAKAPLLALPIPEEAAFLAEIQAEGCAVVRTRETGIFLHTPAGYETVILRVSSTPELAADACILSETAAKRLGLAVGDSLTPKGVAPGWTVTGIEPLLSTNHLINAYGMLVVSGQSPAAWLEALGVSELETLPLSIQITAPEGQVEALEARTRRVFPTTHIGGGEQRGVRAYDVDEMTDEHRTVMMVVDLVMLVLTLMGFVLAAAGILALVHLRTLHHRDGYALLRVYGMTRRDGYGLAAREALRFSLYANVIGIGAGYGIFRGISRTMTGLPPDLSLADPVFWLVWFKCLALSGLVMFLCLLWAYRRLFATEIMDMRRDRPAGREGRLASLLYLACAVLLFSLLMALSLNGGIAQVDVYAFSLGFVLSILAGFGLLLALLYGLFRLCVAVLRLFRLPLRSPVALGYRLALKRKGYTALIGTALIMGLTMVLVMYGVTSGIDGYLENAWKHEVGYTAAGEGDPNLLKQLWEAEGFAYATVFQKSFYVTTVPEGSNAAPYNSVVVIQDQDPASKPLYVEPGTFIATPLFMVLNPVEKGGSFAFFDEPLLLCKEVSHSYTTGMFTPVAFTALLSYEDAKDSIDGSFRVSYLLDLSPEETLRLEELSRQHGFLIYTSKNFTTSLRMAYANYMTLLSLVCALLSLTVAVFVFSLAYVVVWMRRREFTTYKVFGASQRDVERMIRTENILIAILAAVATTAMVTGLFSLLLQNLAFRNIPYSMPIWVVLCVVLCAVLFMAALTMAVIKSFQFGRTVDVLRDS